MTHELDVRLRDWEARLDHLEGKPASSDAIGSHLLFVPSPAGYELVDGAGDSPQVGDRLELDGRERRYTVMRIVGSPLPGDGRRCVYLEAI